MLRETNKIKQNMKAIKFTVLAVLASVTALASGCDGGGRQIKGHYYARPLPRQTIRFEGHSFFFFTTPAFAIHRQGYLTIYGKR